MIDVHTYNNSGSLENMQILNLNSKKYQIKCIGNALILHFNAQLRYLTYFSAPDCFVNVTSAPSVLTSKPPPGKSALVKFPFSAAISSPKKSAMS